MLMANPQQPPTTLDGPERLWLEYTTTVRYEIMKIVEEGHSGGGTKGEKNRKRKDRQQNKCTAHIKAATRMARVGKPTSQSTSGRGITAYGW